MGPILTGFAFGRLMLSRTTGLFSGLGLVDRYLVVTKTRITLSKAAITQGIAELCRRLAGFAGTERIGLSCPEIRVVTPDPAPVSVRSLWRRLRSVAKSSACW